MLADSLKNFHQFIHDLKDDLNDYAIEPLKSTIRTMDQILNPVELVVRASFLAFGRHRLTFSLLNPEQADEYWWGNHRSGFSDGHVFHPI